MRVPSLSGSALLEVMRRAVAANYCKLTGRNQPKKTQIRRRQRVVSNADLDCVTNLRHLARREVGNLPAKRIKSAD
jgi:hypothetical protein